MLSPFCLLFGHDPMIFAIPVHGLDSNYGVLSEQEPVKLLIRDQVLDELDVAVQKHSYFADF